MKHRAAQMFEQALEEARVKYSFLVYGYVIMTEDLTAQAVCLGLPFSVQITRTSAYIGGRGYRMKIRVGYFALLFIVAIQAHTQSANFLLEPATIVESHPFSADLVITWQQQMPNAVPIRGESHGKVYRDSKGRTRIESEGEAPKPRDTLSFQSTISLTIRLPGWIHKVELRTSTHILRNWPRLL